MGHYERRYHVTKCGVLRASQLHTNTIFNSPSMRENTGDRRENRHMGLKNSLADFFAFKSYNSSCAVISEKCIQSIMKSNFNVLCDMQ